MSREHCQSPLTQKQIEVLQLLALGCTYKQTSQILGITIGAVKGYAWRARCKLKAENMMRAVVLALFYHLIDPMGP